MTKRFVDFVQNKDAVAFKDTFESALNEKVFVALEAMKVEVAANFFGEEVNSLDETFYDKTANMSPEKHRAVAADHEEKSNKYYDRASALKKANKTSYKAGREDSERNAYGRGEDHEILSKMHSNEADRKERAAASGTRKAIGARLKNEEVEQIDEALDHDVANYADHVFKAHTHYDQNVGNDYREHASRILKDIADEHGPVGVRWAKANAAERIENHNKKEREDEIARVKANHKPTPPGAKVHQYTKEEVETVDEDGFSSSSVKSSKWPKPGKSQGLPKAKDHVKEDAIQVDEEPLEKTRSGRLTGNAIKDVVAKNNTRLAIKMAAKKKAAMKKVAE